MKYAVVFILGMTPLVVLSTMRGWELAHFKQHVATAQPPAHQDSSGDVAARAAVTAGQWQLAVKDLESPQVFLSDVPPAPLPGVADAEWASAWRKCSQAWRIGDAALSILRRSADGDYAHLDAALQDMQAFLAEHDRDFDTLEGGGAVRFLWKQRIAQFQLAAAVAARDSGRYGECLTLCDKLLADHADAVAAAQARGLKAGAAYCEAAARVRSDLADIGQPLPKLATAKRIDKLKQRRNCLSKFVDAHRKDLSANEACIPATARREFADWEKELQDFPASLQRLEAMAGAQRLEQRRRNAQKLLDESQSAFEKRQYDKCRKLCDELLTDYPDVISADTATVTNRKNQSFYAEAVERLRTDLDAIGDATPGMPATDRIALLTRRRDRLQAFDDQYHHAMETSEPWITPALRGKFTDWHKQLQEVPGKIAQLEAVKAKEVLQARTQEARQLEDEYRRALSRGQYKKCLDLCKKLAPYADIVSADRIARASNLAKFLRSIEQLNTGLKAAGDKPKTLPSQEIARLNRRTPLLRHFVNQYQKAVEGGDAWVDASVRNEFAKRKAELQGAPNQVRAQEAKWEAYFNNGLSLGREGKWRESIAAFSESIALNPTNPRLYLNRGVVRIKNQDFRDAITDLSEAIRLDPKYGKAYAMRSYALQKVGDAKEAGRDKATALSLGETVP